jgi:beta-glucanase (GH16 family)
MSRSRYTHALVLAAAFLAAATSIQAQCYQLVWSDEFDGTELDLSNWSYEIGDGCPDLCGWGNNELQYYREENTEVSGGSLKINILEESFGGRDYTSSRLITRDKRYFASGRIEASMKMPTGQGMWPAFWMLSQENFYGGWPLSGEIDIMEMIGSIPNEVHGTVHFGPLFPRNRWIGDSYFLPSGSLADGFHEYAIEWEDGEIRWYLDGVQYATRTASELSPDPWRFDRDFFIILNTAVGGWFPGPPDASTVFPQVMEVDYVRVYQDVQTSFISGREEMFNDSRSNRFYVPDFDAANYTWSVPSDATILTGQGSSEVTVEWGSTPGAISVEVDAPSCLETISKNITVVNPECRYVVRDWESNPEKMYWLGAEGVYEDAVANPGTNSLNSSDSVAYYERNPGVDFNAVRFAGDFISDADLFKTGNWAFEVDVRTTANVGAKIDVQLEQVPKSSGSFPLGRHSTYSANTTKQNDWERLRFSLSQTPDAAVGSHQVNQLLIMPQPGTSSSQEYWFDNFALVDLNCATGIEEEAIKEPSIFPNPVEDVVWIESDVIIEEILLYDLGGRLIQQRALLNTQGNLSLTDLQAGVYFLELRSAKGTWTQKIIKV